MLLTCVSKDLKWHHQLGDSCLVTYFPVLPHQGTDRGQDMPVLGQRQHSSVSFPLGVASCMDSRNSAQTNEGCVPHVTLWSDAPRAAAFPRSGTVTLSHSPIPCLSIPALASDLAAVQLLWSWMSKLVRQETVLFFVDLFSTESDHWSNLACSHPDAKQGWQGREGHTGETWPEIQEDVADWCWGSSPLSPLCYTFPFRLHLHLALIHLHKECHPSGNGTVDFLPLLPC